MNKTSTHLPGGTSVPIIEMRKTDMSFEKQNGAVRVGRNVFKRFKNDWLILISGILLVFGGLANLRIALAAPALDLPRETGARQLTDSPEDKMLLGTLLQGHLQQLTKVIRSSPRVEVVAYGGATEKSRLLPVCKRLLDDILADRAHLPVTLARQCDGDDAYYQRVSAIAKEYAPAQEERQASHQTSFRGKPIDLDIFRQNFRGQLNSWFLDRDWTYRGMYFSVSNSMTPDSEPRRYVHDLWLYTNGKASDGRPRYLQLEFFAYQEVGSNTAKIDSISAYDLTPDRGFGDHGYPRLGFNGSWSSKQRWGAEPLKDQYEAFGVMALDEKVIAWNLYRNPGKSDVPKDWRQEPWSFKTEIYSDLPINENSSSLTCSFLIK